MNWRVLAIWTVKIALAAVVIWIGKRWLADFDKVYAAGDPFAVMTLFGRYLLVGAIVLGIFAIDIVFGIGNRVAGMIFPEVDDVEVRPQYSVAEARAREGRHQEAIAEFRKVIEKYPDDVNAHVRIAEILCNHFQRHDDAVTELRLALAKPGKDETWAFLANRLVDIQVEHLHDYVAARTTLQEILLRLPDTRYAEAAHARVLALNDREAHEHLPPRPPLKVPDRPAEEWT